ncbi:hypothetical protein [uncultured Legionella sp.]|uniref:hypothetical protein n=1 Tax=uncultured Legionella sp. TaxID=210934 RepID=UPI00262D4614|nr:hypothetical protein [uncultured Legionella sp.]
MKPIIFYCLFIVLPVTGFTASANEEGSYWQCITRDKTDREWTARNSYQKVAINIAFDACKKESEFPASCKAAKSDCEGFYRGMSTKPLWRCTALDQTAEPWFSNFYSQRDDAALAARAYCRENSTVPDTCYINMVTCRNFNEGVLLQ